jgi:mannose-6-phosphate isomerase-like protein (cupin superfamily)
MKDRKSLPLETFNEDNLKVLFFAGEADWHIEERDELFIIFDGNIEFCVEDKSYTLKKHDLLVIKSGTRHRASSSGVVMLSVEPHQ